jgi:cytochrome c oxidase cbb3-type subunit III
MDVVAGTGPALWGDNCAVCHGLAGVGGPGFPNLVDEAWLWGGDDETVMESIRAGINAAHPESRFAQMPPFEGVLTRDEIRALVAHVRSLSGLAPANAEGETLFLDNCSSCHDEDATGMNDVGAPNLTDASWIYGSEPEVVFDTIHDGRQGWMPHWEGRLGEAEQKILALYLLDVLAEAE